MTNSHDIDDHDGCITHLKTLCVAALCPYLKATLKSALIILCGCFSERIGIVSHAYVQTFFPDVEQVPNVSQQYLQNGGRSCEFEDRLLTSEGEREFILWTEQFSKHAKIHYAN